MSIACDIIGEENVEKIVGRKLELLTYREFYSEELFEEIKNANPKHTDTIILPGCNHGNGMYKQTEMYQSAIIDFIESCVK